MPFLLRSNCLIPLLAIVLFAGCGQSAPAPTSQESLASLKHEAESRRDAMLAKPSQGVQELGLFVESVEAYSSNYGEPFTGYLATVKQIQSALGAKPDAAAIKASANQLVEEANKLGA